MRRRPRSYQLPPPEDALDRDRNLLGSRKEGASSWPPAAPMRNALSLTWMLDRALTHQTLSLPDDLGAGSSHSCS